MSVKVRKVTAAADLAADLGLRLLGENFEITNLCSIYNPQPFGLAFLNEQNTRLLDRSPDLPKELVIISKYPVKSCATILSDNPTLDFVRAVHTLIDPDEMLDDFEQENPIHPNVIIDPRGVKIGLHSVICSGAVISEGCIIGPNCYIGKNVRIGARTVLQPGVKILRGCVVGSDCTIGAGTVIGSEGFGYIRGASGLIKFPQLGRVVVGNGVEIGANVTIDRGALDDTVISNGVKLDNLVQIGHNVFIGENSVICGQVGIAGSSVIGRDCVLGGQVGVADHVKICDGVRVGGKSGVQSNIAQRGDYLGNFGVLEASLWRRFVGFLRLEFKKRSKRSNVKRRDEN